MKIRLLIKLCLSTISKILVVLRLHSRIVNQLNKLRSESHKIDNHSNLVSKLLGDKRLVALDVGAQGGFFNGNIFDQINILLSSLSYRFGLNSLKLQDGQIHSYGLIMILSGIVSVLLLILLG